MTNNNQPLKGLQGESETEDYNPISCNHKKQNGLSAYDLQSAFTSSGALEIIREFNVWVCLKCGEIKISAKQDVGDKIGYIQQEFSIYMPNAVAAIVKNCNYMNKETDGYTPLVRQSKQPTQNESATVDEMAERFESEEYAKYGWSTKQAKTPLQITCKVRTECVGYNGYYLTEDNAIEAIKKYASQIEYKRKQQVEFYKKQVEQLQAAYNMRDKEQAWNTKDYPQNDKQVLIKDLFGGRHLAYCDTTMRCVDELEVIWQVSGIGTLDTDEVYGWMELPE